MKKFEHLFVPKELADKLKGFGYNEDSLYYWFPDVNHKLGDKFGLVHKDTCIGAEFKSVEQMTKDGLYTNTVAAPLLEEVCDWFLKRHDIYISSTYGMDKKFSCIVQFHDQNVYLVPYKDTKREALIEGIEYALTKALNFWYESNACWGNVYTIDDLVEKARLQADPSTIFKTVDIFLDSSKESSENNYGTRREHTGEKTLREYLEEKGALMAFISKSYLIYK